MEKCIGLKMARVHCKITPLSIYLTALATYSVIMMLICLENDQQEDVGRKQERTDETSVEEHPITNLKERRQGRWVKTETF